MSSRKKKIFLVAAAVLLAASLFTILAMARPGGGSSFGGSSGGGGGGGDDGGILWMIFWVLLQLCIEHPAIGIPLMLLFIAIVVGIGVVKAGRAKWKDWQSGSSPGTAKVYSAPQHTYSPAVVSPVAVLSAKRQLEAIRSSDQNFSITLFEDFIYSLYSMVHTLRGGNRLEQLAAYVAPASRGNLTQFPASEVKSIVVGSMKCLGVNQGADSMTWVQVEFETNYTEVDTARREQSYYVLERWKLARRMGVLSRTPDRVRVFGCPSCGAPLDAILQGSCRYCQQKVDTGAFDWIVADITVLRREPRGPLLTSTTEEAGTQLPTVVDAQARGRLSQIQAKDPSFRWETLQARAGLIFTEFQLGWSTRDLSKMRPFMSDNLFQTQVYWVETYKQQRLRNITERARILGIELARVDSDRFYDSVTIRVWATGLDYTVRDGDNAIVSGNRSKERAYSEYWTLIRGASRAAPSRSDKACSNCGAPLQINMAGHCEYCQAKVSSGEFDWVLSRIEQDEVYAG